MNMLNIFLPFGNQVILSKRNDCMRVGLDLQETTLEAFGLRSHKYKPPYIYKNYDMDFYLDAMTEVLSIFGLRVIKPYFPKENVKMLIKDSKPYKMSHLNVDDLLKKAGEALFNLSGLQNELNFDQKNQEEKEIAMARIDMDYQKTVICILNVVSNRFFNRNFVDNIEDLNDFPQTKNVYKQYLLDMNKHDI